MKDHLEDLSIDGKDYKNESQRNRGKVCTGFVWLTIGSSGVPLWTW